MPAETQHRLQLEGQTVWYRVRRSKRARRISLRVTPAEGLVVVLPLRCKIKTAEKLLLSQAEWVLRRAKGNPRLLSPESALRPTLQTALWYRGRKLKFKYIPGTSKRARISLEDSTLVVETAPESDVEEVVARWLKQQARRVLLQEIKAEAERLGLEFNKLYVASQRTRWGSCSAKGNLAFNWRLVLAPPEVLHYFVVHELCHLKHRNHSRGFWQAVESACPEYRKAREWLKANGASLWLAFPPVEGS